MGSYSWQVQLIDSSGIRIGRARQFTVSANATPFLVPDAAALLNRVMGRGASARAARPDYPGV